MSEPNNPDKLREDIEKARRELGDTVADAADGVDVPDRTKAEINGTAQAAKDAVTAAKYQTLATGDKVREKAQNARDIAEDKADQAQFVAKEKTRQVAEQVESSVPDPVIDRGRQAAEVARRNPLPLAAVAISGVAVIWWLARRRRS
ncbi:DUF3618 domain-containing protein [Nocardia sp. AG03]|uniref:DUF3618 domain-containing protein n=1 Tax=Nocardia sp. AG03 TaxID=3025312 RepID=UPI0024183CD9|nr:DUF3618 domain-containing protein [Nocardia sp. AG03]